MSAFSAAAANNPPPLFLLGSSMGGAVALAVADELGTGGGGGGRKGEEKNPEVRGVVLLAPMLALSVSNPLRYALRALSLVVPSVPLIPSSASSSEDQYRDPQKREECDSDPLTVKGNLRPSSAYACVDLTERIQSRFGEIDVSFLCMVARDDRVVNNDGSRLFLERSVSKDKELREFDALHGLLCEPEPLLTSIHGELLSWLKARS